MTRLELLAQTGYGKTMAFGLLAVAAEIAGFRGVVTVICPLKALQKDQVSIDLRDASTGQQTYMSSGWAI
jgi:superfamily II DNA helicase RecQ